MSFTSEDKQDSPDLSPQPLSESQSPRAIPPPGYGSCAYTRHVSSPPPPACTHAHTHTTIMCACSQFAQQIAGMRFCEASAKDNFNVDEIFLKLVDDILKKVKKKKRIRVLTACYLEPLRHVLCCLWLGTSHVESKPQGLSGWRPGVADPCQGLSPPQQQSLTTSSGPCCPSSLSLAHRWSGCDHLWLVFSCSVLSDSL